jgi:hypothetical protein
MNRTRHGVPKLPMLPLAALFLTAVAASSPAEAADTSKCAGKLFVLWGDGRHDDTVALNAWFRGDPVVWGATGRTVGAQISDHVFRLSSPVYIHSGTGRSIAHFQFVWPERKELVAGGTITAGGDPNGPPVATGLTKIGAGPGEGVPYPSHTPKPADPDRTGCLVS